MPTVKATPVDPRDQTWETQPTRYRAYFYDADGTSDEWELGDVNAAQALAWAQHTCAGRRYDVYARVDHGGLGLVLLAQSPDSTRPHKAPGATAGSEEASAARPESWNSQNFSLANALNDQPGDLPHLLRRVATAIEDHAITADALLDITISSETTAEGPWWSATVYWSAQGG